MPYYGGDFDVSDKSIPEHIWESFKKYGERIAIVDASRTGKSVTYLELYDNSRKCTAYLQSLGVKKGDYISICAAGSVEFTCLAIGILGSGAVVAPCNPSYRKNEVLQQFNISRPRIVFVDEEGVATMKAVKAEVPFLERIFVVGESTEFTTLNKILSDADPANLTQVQFDSANDVAFLPHSSGTTGLPKCIMTTHRNSVASMTIGAITNVDLSLTSYCDRPMYYLGGYSTVLTYVTNGIKVITEREFNIDKFFKCIESYRIALMLCTPPMLIEMVNATDSDQYDLSSLKIITVGGAAIAPDIIQRTIKKYKVSFVTAYGMTEAGVVSAGPVLEGDTSPSSGKVQKGVEIKITDVVTGEECQTGSNGEIRIKSPQAAKGYLRNPSANAAAFDEDGWYRTGDIGHLDKLGNLYVVDRLKEIIKYGTVQVSDVGVVGIPDEANGEVPKAFVVSNDPSLTVEDIHKIVNENLVEYKHLRGGVEFVDSIPKSQTGKIQKNVLKKMAGF